MAEEINTSTENNAEEDQEVVTLNDILQTEQQMMDDANAVLGAIDDKKCSYSEGYMKRQALYSCLTCIPEAKRDFSKAAGVCLACCYYCHEGHELIELYTKRNFRCDCGNKKFSDRPCNLDNNKSDGNEFNQYNQNFSGSYCICKRPYPDAEDTIVDEMIQCIICEDWFHSRHLDVEIPDQNSYSEMSCGECVKKHPFLMHYDSLSANKAVSDEDTLNSDDVEISDTNPEASTSSKISVKSFASNTVCKKPPLKTNLISTKFWIDTEWRTHLCKCSDCIKMYEKQHVLFLLDPQDTVQVYEEKGKERAREFEAKRQENDMKFINSLDRVPLMEAIAGYNDLKANLMEYLKKFAENKKVVREEDIKEFFSQFDSKKKQKTNIPYYCR